MISRLLRWLAVLATGVVAALAGMFAWKKARPEPPRTDSPEAREAETKAAAGVAAVDAEAQRRIEEAANGGATALCDRIANRR